MSGKYPCLWCESTRLEDLETPCEDYWVTGDRRVFRCEKAHFSRKICTDCGVIQFYRNHVYTDATKKIFATYNVLCNKVRGGGADVFLPKLELICMQLKENANLPARGSLLDIGCGGGEFLSRFHHYFPDWECYGMDLGSQFSKEVLSKPGVKGFFTSCEEVKESLRYFDLITMNSMLSLANNSTELLALTYDSLTGNGKGFIQETDYTVQPWVLFELETISSFDKETVNVLLQRNGFEVLKNVYEESNKEFGYIFSKSTPKSLDTSSLYENNKKNYERIIRYINDVIETVRKEVKHHQAIGIFGTSLAGLWLVQAVRDVVSEPSHIFFIDEDEDLLGKRLEGYDVLCPKDVTENAVVFFPFPKYVSSDIIHRMKAKQYLENCKFVIL